MRHVTVLIFTLLMLPTMSLAEMSAGRLSTDLDLADSEGMAPEQGMRLLLAAGYVQGAGEMGNKMLFCLPPKYTNAQLLGLVRNLLHQFPERGNEPAVVLVREALTSAFPCVGR
jgi:hypothetical protein